MLYCIVLYNYVAGRLNLHVNSFPTQVSLSQLRSICLKLDQLVLCYCKFYATCLNQDQFGAGMGHRSLFANTGIILNIHHS